MIQNHLSPLLSLFTQVAQFQVSTGGSLLMSRVAHFLVDILIHMALEKWLLEKANSTPKDDLESMCLYLIRNSKSASITAVVVSLVLAHPFKLFNIAKILFKTKEFFLYDTGRLSSDQSAKSLYSIGNGLLDFQNKIFQDERLKTCDDPHRKRSLEDIATFYQFYRLEGEDENVFNERQKIIWEIFDKYYETLPDKSIETDADKIWRLCLARMDRRKMRTEIEEKNGQILMKINPEIDPDLKKYSEDSISKSVADMKYMSLKLWSDYRFRREEDKYQQYQQYENNPQLVIAEIKEIIEGLKNKTENTFSLFYHSTPAFACSVLIRDFFDKLKSDEMVFFKEVTIDFASIPLRTKNYFYQASDGTEPSIIILPNLIKHFPKEKNEIKLLLLLLLLNPWKEISTFTIRGIHHSLWETNFDDAHAIFLGYLSLKTKYDDLRNKIKKENYQKKIFVLSETQVIEIFIKNYKSELDKIVSNRITYNELNNLEKLDFETLVTAFELLPLKIENEDHIKFLNKVFPVFSKNIFLDDEKVNYSLKHRFLEKLADFILNLTKNEIEKYLKPFIDNFSISREMAEFFQMFMTVEDRLNKYEEFWTVWNLFYDKIVEICNKQSFYNYTQEILHSYLLAWLDLKEDVKEWHPLRDREKLFFKKVAEDIGHHPSVLYSLSKILNDIGSNFIDDGVMWISNILKKNKELISQKLETNTIYYIENIIRRFIITNRQKIKTTLQIKKKVIIILNFLVERGSVTGYLLREDIL